MDWIEVRKKLEKEWKDKSLKDIQEELSKIGGPERGVLEGHLLISVLLCRAFEEIEKLKKDLY